MKVELLEEIGIHKTGTVLDIDDTMIQTLERNGKVKRIGSNQEVLNIVPVQEVKRKGNPNWGKK